jgi:pyridoxal biosynthesis lyase PdxS
VGVILDLVAAEQARIAEGAGARRRDGVGTALGAYIG